MLQPDERQRAIADMLALRNDFPKLDMPEGMIRQFSAPPRSPKECIFALTTQTLSADLRTKLFLVNSAEIRTARLAGASRQWAWLP